MEIIEFSLEIQYNIQLHISIYALHVLPTQEELKKNSTKAFN